MNSRQARISETCNMEDLKYRGKTIIWTTAKSVIGTTAKNAIGTTATTISTTNIRISDKEV